MSARVSEPGIWGKFQSAAGENLQNRVRAREIRTNKVVNKEARPTPATRRLVLVIVKNTVYASYTYKPGDYWVANKEDGSDAYAVSKAIFEKMYEQID